MTRKKNVTPKRKTSKIYVIVYDQQEFVGYDVNTPIKAFRTKKTAEIYADSRNFEFQSVCMLDDEDYENYVLSNQYSDFIIAVSDFRDAFSYIKEEMIRLEKYNIPSNIWKVLQDIRPFKVVPVEYCPNKKKKN